MYKILCGKGSCSGLWVYGRSTCSLDPYMCGVDMGNYLWACIFGSEQDVVYLSCVKLVDQNKILDRSMHALSLLS